MEEGDEIESCQESSQSVAKTTGVDLAGYAPADELVHTAQANLNALKALYGRQLGFDKEVEASPESLSS